MEQQNIIRYRFTDDDYIQKRKFEEYINMVWGFYDNEENEKLFNIIFKQGDSVWIELKYFESFLSAINLTITKIEIRIEELKTFNQDLDNNIRLLVEQLERNKNNLIYMMQWLNQLILNN